MEDASRTGLNIPPRRLNSLAVRQGSPPREASPVSPSRSYSQSAWAWLWTFSSTNNQVVTSILGRGAQAPVARATSANAPRPTTEIAIVTPEGLKAYIYDPEQPSSPLILEPEDLDDGDDSGSDQEDSVTTTYHAFAKDFEVILGHLQDLEFGNLPISQEESLSDQIAGYLARPIRANPIGTGPPVRVLICSGHSNDNTGSFSTGQTPEQSYHWIQLTEALRHVPRHVLMIPILACCYAGDGVNILMDRLERGHSAIQLVMMASSREGQRSWASSANGDHFLGALFDTLQSPRVREKWHCWDNFMAQLMRKFDTNRQVHGSNWLNDPIHEQAPHFVRAPSSADVAPCHVFHDLVKRQRLPRGINLATAQV